MRRTRYAARAVRVQGCAGGQVGGRRTGYYGTGFAPGLPPPPMPAGCPAAPRAAGLPLAPHPRLSQDTLRQQARNFGFNMVVRVPPALHQKSLGDE